MTFPVHTLHIYQKPKLGTAFLARKPVFGYRHRINVMGWFDTASCQVGMTQTEAETAYGNWIGNRAAVYADNPVEPIWEGLISRVTFEAGGVTFTNSLDQMFNKVKGVSRSPTGAASTMTAAVSTTASQAIYGIKEGSLDALLEGPTGTTRVTELRDKTLALQSWPVSAFNLGGRANIVYLEMIGFYYTLQWESITGIDAIFNPDTFIENRVAALANGNTFIDNTDLSMIETNTAVTVNGYNQEGMTLWEQFLKVTEPGDGANTWIVGVLPSNPAGDRLVYYRQANTDIEYTARVRDGLRIRNLQGGLVRPWAIVPDRGLRVQDVLIGWAAQGDDPREMYVASVEYDAERQSVVVGSADDLTTEGVFQFQRYAKMHGSRFTPSRM